MKVGDEVKWTIWETQSRNDFGVYPVERHGEIIEIVPGNYLIEDASRTRFWLPARMFPVPAESTQPFEIEHYGFHAHIVVTHDTPPNEEAVVTITSQYWGLAGLFPIVMNVRGVSNLHFFLRKVLNAIQSEP